MIDLRTLSAASAVGLSILVGMVMSSSCVVAQETKPAVDEVVDEAEALEDTIDEAIDEEGYDEPEFIEREVFGVDAIADRLLRSMGEYLASAPAMTFHVEVADDRVLPTGQKIQYGGSADIAVQRPGSLHAYFKGQERHTRVFINDGRCTIYDMEANHYAVADVPKPLDDAMDRVVEKYGFTVPLADLVYADPYATLIENVEYGIYVGSVAIDGVNCAHLAFAQETIDWQVWIEVGPRPVPRKLLITYRSDPGSPQYTARLSNWNFAPRLASQYFEFHPPTGASEVEFILSKDAEETP